MTERRAAIVEESRPAAAQPRVVAFAALRHPHYRAYWAGIMLSMMADNIEHVISYWMIWEAFHSPLLGGFAVISHWTPHLLFSVYFGSLADRYDCRKIIQASQVLFIAASLAWGLLFLTNSLQVWHAVVLLIVHGLAGALWSPASQVMVHDIVGRQHLQSAVRLSSTGRQLGQLAGPALGGAMLFFLGPAVGLLINALIYLPLTAWLLVTPFTGHSREGVVARRASLRLSEVLQAIREVSGNRIILAMVALAGFSSVLVGNAYQAQMPAFASALVPEQAGIAYSALFGANAAGAVMGGLLLEGRGLLPPHPRSAIVLAALWCLSIVGFAAAPYYALALGLLVLAGFFMLAFNSMAQTLVQLEAPAELRGRAVGLLGMAQQGLRVGSGMTVGVLGSIVGVHWSLGLSAGLLLVVILALLGVVLRAERRVIAPAT